MFRFGSGYTGSVCESTNSLDCLVSHSREDPSCTAGAYNSYASTLQPAYPVPHYEPTTPNSSQRRLRSIPSRVLISPSRRVNKTPRSRHRPELRAESPKTVDDPDFSVSSLSSYEDSSEISDKGDIDSDVEMAEVTIAMCESVISF